MNGLYNKIQKGIYKKISKQYSPELSEFIDRCLKKKTAKRASVDELLNMPIVQNYLNRQEIMNSNGNQEKEDKK